MSKEKIRRIMTALARAYGKPRRMSRSDPMDTLVETILSQNTTDKNSHRAFRDLKRRFRSWEGLRRSSLKDISKVIKSAGLANIKAARIKDALEEIKRREGVISLKSLRRLSAREALDYLLSLNGVGMKTASCVLLFSFNRPAMPVDTHIFRVAKRLSIIPKDETIAGAHRRLTGLVPKKLIYPFHLGIIEHGRKTCRARRPLCGDCALFGFCEFKGKEKGARRIP